MIKTLIIRWVARNLDSLIDFLTGLDAQLDLYIEKQNAEDERLEQQKVDINKRQESVRNTRNVAVNLKSGVKALTQ